MKLTDLLLNRWLYKTPLQNIETKDAVYDASNVIPSPVPALAAGSAAQDLNTGNVNINGAVIEPGTIPPETLDVSNWGWGQTCAFTSATNVQVNWGAGTFKSAGGVTYSISAGNTGTMAAKTYIYLDLNISSAAYQTTTNPALAVGLGKVLIAVAQNATSPNLATYNLSEATQIVGDNILANSISASKIVTGQLIVGTNVGLGTAQDSAGVTTIIGNTVTTGYVNALSVVAGSVAAENITGTTITGKVFQTSAPGTIRATMNAELYSGGNDSSLVFYNASNQVIGGVSAVNADSVQHMTFSVGISDSMEADLGLNASANKYKWTSHNAGGVYSDVAYVDGLGDAYFAGDITLGGTVDGIDVAGHTHTGGAGGTVAHSSLGSIGADDHHSSTSNGLNITPASVVVGGVVRGSASNSYDLGSTSYYWSNLYVDYIKFNSTYGQILWGTTVVCDFYNTYTIWQAHFDPYGAGSYNLGGSTRYWNDVSYKTLTDRGCLGWFDDGVELQDGKIVSDLEALESIKKHPTLKTVYGTPRLDYKSMPKCIYRKAADHDGKELERDENDRPFIIDKKTKKKIYAEDGAETTALISIMLGSIKELSAKIKKLENK